MRKWISIVAAALTVMGMTACGHQGAVQRQASSQQTTPATVPPLSSATQRNEYHVVDRSNSFDEILLSQKWTYVPKGEVLDVGGDERAFPYDMASLEIEVRIVNPSRGPIYVTTAYQLRDSRENTIGEFVAEAGLTREEDLNSGIELGPKSQRNISVVVPLHNAGDFRGKEPLYVHQMGRDLSLIHI